MAGAFFNPKPISFNLDSGVIGASGAMGGALYKLYQDSMQNAREQDKLDLAKQNAEWDKAHKDQVLANSIENAQIARQNADKDYAFMLNEVKRNQANWDKKYNADLDMHRQNYALKQQELAQEQAYHNATLGLKQQELNNANLSNAFLAQSLQNDPNLMKDLNISQDELSQASKFGVNGIENLYKAKVALAKNAKNLGVGMEYKQQNQKAQSQIRDGFNVLSAFNQSLNDTNQMGGISKNSGVFDKALYHLGGNINGSDSAVYQGNINRIADAVQQYSKGNGKYNRENVIDRLSPGWLGSGQASQNTIQMIPYYLEAIQNNIDQGKAQGYKGMDEAQAELDRYKQLLNMSDVSAKLQGNYKEQNPSSQSTDNQVMEHFKKEQAKKQQANNAVYFN